jgi:hypothetical protein
MKLKQKWRSTYCHSHNNWGPRNSFQRFLVPAYYWKTVEKPCNWPSIIMRTAVYTERFATAVCIHIYVKMPYEGNWCVLNIQNTPSLRATVYEQNRIRFLRFARVSWRFVHAFGLKYMFFLYICVHVCTCMPTCAYTCMPTCAERSKTSQKNTTCGLDTRRNAFWLKSMFLLYIHTCMRAHMCRKQSKTSQKIQPAD